MKHDEVHNRINDGWSLIATAGPGITPQAWVQKEGISHPVPLETLKKLLDRKMIAVIKPQTGDPAYMTRFQPI